MPSPLTRILAVNLRAGGARRTIDGLLARTLAHDPDVVVFSEYRAGASGRRIDEAMADAGYGHRASSSLAGENGVFVAARAPFVAMRDPFGMDDDAYPSAILQAIFEDGLRLYGLYLPGQARKRPHLRCLIAEAQYCDERGIRALCIGDMNSGRDATDIEINDGGRLQRDAFDTADLYAELERHWTEAWLHEHPDVREFSWYPLRLDPEYRSRNGWRIDKAFLSRALLPELRGAEYDHGFRTERLTDHSALVVTLGR